MEGRQDSIIVLPTAMLCQSTECLLWEVRVRLVAALPSCWAST